MDNNVDNKETETETKTERTNNTFVKGMLLGILITLFFFLCMNVKSYMRPLKSSDKIMAKLNEISYLIDRFSINPKDEEKMADMICLGMLAGLDDKYVGYYNKEDLKLLKETIEGEYVGIGVIVLQDQTDGLFVVVKVTEDSPAEKAGIKVGDKIIKVDDKNLDNYKSDEVISMVKGKPDTNVKITMYRKSDDKNYDFVITRKKINSKIVTGKMLDEQIGYIKIDNFEGKADEQLLELKKEFETKNVKGVILDLRNNPGGNLDVLENIANVFLDKKLITYFEDKYGKKTYYKTKDGSWNLPVVILTNEYTASAAEALTGAIRDNKIGISVGNKTYGKGVVQEMYSLSDGTVVKFTTAKYYTPNGKCIDGVGIEPDIKVENEDLAEDKQLNVAIEKIKEMIK